MLKKVLSGVIALSIAISSISAVFAETNDVTYDFTSGPSFLKVEDGGGITSSAGGNKGVFGKDAEDTSRFGTVKANGQTGFANHQFPDDTFTGIIDSGLPRVLEFNMAFTGNYDSVGIYGYMNNAGGSSFGGQTFIQFNADGTVLVNGAATGKRYTLRGWNRVALMAHNNSGIMSVYLNGEKLGEVTMSSMDKSNKFRWIRTKISVSGTNSATCFLDDVKYTSAEYVPNTTALLSLTDDSYSVSDTTIVAPDGATAESLLAAIDKTGIDNAAVYADENCQSTVTGALSSQNVLALESTDMTKYEYYNISFDVPKDEVYFDFTSGAAFESIESNNASFEQGGISGLYGKDAADNSRFAYVTADASGSGYSEHRLPNDAFDKVNTSMAPRVMSFNIAFGGEYESVVVHGYFTDQDGNPYGGDRSYIGFNGDGTVSIEDSVVSGVTYNKTGWNQVALEAINGTQRVRVYLNGRQLAELWLSSKGQIKSFRWLNARVTAPAGKTARCYLDDVRYITESYSPVYAFEYPESENFAVTGTVMDVYSAQLSAQALIGELSGLGRVAVYTDSGLSQLNDGMMQAGNVVVVENSDKSRYEYLTVQITDKDLITSNDYNSATSAPGQYDTNNTGAEKSALLTGLYGKADDDKSSVLYVENLDGATKSASRSSDSDLYTFALGRAEDTTLEMSLAGDGDWDYIELYGKGVEKSGDTFDAFPLIRFYNTGKVYTSYNKELNATFKQSEWNRVAITIHPSTLTYDVYLNNEKIADNEYLSNDKTDPSEYSFNGFGWMSVRAVYETVTEEAKNGKVCWDDVIIYNGGYRVSDANLAGVEVDDYVVNDKRGYILLDEGMSYRDLNKLLSATGDVTVYTDNTYTDTVAIADVLEEGNVMLVESENGLVKKYYTIVNSINTQLNDAVVLKQNGKFVNSLSEGEVSATVNIDAADSEGTLILAVYKNGALEDVVIQTKAIAGETEFNLTYNITDPSFTTVKGMFIKDFETMTPYCGANALECL